jgi:cell division protein FtsB
MKMEIKNKKVVKQAKLLYYRVKRIWYMKYVVVLAVGVLVIGFIDENSVWNHLKNKQRISELQEEIDHYTQSYNHDKARIRELNSNPKAIEKIARERYFMKCDDEDIFVLSDDERVPQRQEPVENMDDDERAE